MKYIGLFVIALSVLAACGEKKQDLTMSKSESQAFNGTKSSFMAPGWKPGDKASWEQHMKARQQNTQNEYTKVN